MKTSEQILKSKLSVKTILQNSPDYTFNKIIEAMEEYSNQSRWISVSDRRPPEYEAVLWLDSRDGNINLGYFVWSQTPVPYCTHWQPLPEKP